MQIVKKTRTVGASEIEAGTFISHTADPRGFVLVLMTEKKDGIVTAYLDTKDEPITFKFEERIITVYYGPRERKLK
jgi:hypothetical protein